MGDTLLRPDAVDTGALLDELGRWVNMETPSERPDLVNRLTDHIESRLDGLPVTRERIAGSEGRGDHLVLRYDPAGDGGPAATVMGHIDTVWPVGTLAARPLRRDGDRLFGPGIYDMKAGTLIAVETLRTLAAAGTVPPRPVTVLVNSDEEVGSPTSRTLIEDVARRSAFVLVPEPGIGPDAAAVTARKGWGRFVLRVEGRPAHAGGNRAEGRSAIREIARHVLELEAMNEEEAGVSVNVGVIRGGTRMNVVPAEAEIEVDLRVPTMAAGEAAVAAILGRRPFDPDTRVLVEGGINRPPFTRTAEVAALYEAARTLAGRLGFELPETARGGVSDGNFPAALGVPVLDGLGAGGHGAHAVDEHIRVSTLPQRAALMHAMLTSAQFQAQDHWR